MRFKVNLDLSKVYRKYAIFIVNLDHRPNNGERLELVVARDLAHDLINLDSGESERVSLDLKEVSTIGC